MEEQTVNHLDNLLLQLGIETRELVQRRDDLKQQVHICESNIQEKKDYIDTTQKTIRTLDEEILQKQNTVKFIKENTKNLQHTGTLLLQYEKTLEAELEKRQDSYDQDMKMFEDRIESYKSVFQQHKERYCLNSLAQKLLEIQVENEEIDRRIRVTEGQIIEKERELTATLGEDDPASLTDVTDSYKNSKNLDNTAQQSECNETSDETGSHQDHRSEKPDEYTDDCNMTVEEVLEERKDTTEDRKDFSEPQMSAFCHSIWTKQVTGDLMPEGDQKQSEEDNQLEGNVNVSCGFELMEETVVEKEADDLEKSRASAQEEESIEGAICPPPSPARMKAILSTPTFSLNSSPSSSPGRQDSSENKSPGFVFTMNSGPSTSAFSGLGCFDMGTAAEEASPFTFTSPYFSDKKSSELGPKFSGFLFDEAESRPEEFSFSFSTESPQQKSSSQESPGSGDSFPFSFNFGKL